MIRAALKSLLGRKVRLLMSTFAIVLGVAFVVGTLIFSDTLNRSFTALFASTVGDVVVGDEERSNAQGEPTGKIVPASLVDELAALPGAARADGNVTAVNVYLLDRDDKPIGGFGPPALAGNYTDAPSAAGEGLAIIEGRAPEGADEVVLFESTAESGDYGVGDTVPVLLPDGAQTRITPTVVGILGFPEGGSLNGATFMAFDTATAQDFFLNGKNAFNDIWITAKDGVSQEELAAQAREVLPDNVEAVTGDDAADEAADPLLDAISFITIFLLVFAAIALVVGIFLIVNTFSMLVAQRTRELALMRALGASRRQVLWSVQLEAFVLGVLGATIGIGLGVLLAIGLRALFALIGLDLSGQPMVFEPLTFVAGYAVGILVTMFAAFFPARRTTRIAPIQALRDDVALPESSLRTRFQVGLVLALLGVVSLVVGLGDVVEVDGGGWFVGLGILAILLGVAAASPVISQPFLALAQAVYARVFGAIGNLAGQNSLRNPRRTTATASALMIGLTLACTMSMIGSSAKATVDVAVEESFVGDYVISNSFGGGFNPAVGEQVLRVDGVEEVLRQRFQIVGDDFQGIAGVDPGTLELYELTMVEGDIADLSDETLFVSEGFADDNDLQIGDDYEVPLLGERTATWKVTGIFEDNPVVSFPIVTTIGTFDKVGFKAQDNFLFVFVAPGADADAVRADLQEIVDGFPIITLKDQGEFAEEQRAPIDQFVLIIYALLGLALFIAFLGIVNTLALSVIERTREVGLLRAVGVTRRQTWKMITLESVAISLLGALLGVILGLGFGLAILTAVRDEGLEVISVPWGQIVLFLVLAVIAGIVAALLPARRAAKLDVLKAIATD